MKWLLDFALRQGNELEIEKVEFFVFKFGILHTLPTAYIRVLYAYFYSYFEPLKQNNINLQAGVSCCRSLESCNANKI